MHLVSAGKVNAQYGAQAENSALTALCGCVRLCLHTHHHSEPMGPSI